jgi:hypothetical protein
VGGEGIAIRNVISTCLGPSSVSVLVVDRSKFEVEVEEIDSEIDSSEGEAVNEDRGSW